MKKMLEQYAGAMIAAMVSLGIFGIFYGYSFGNGIAFSNYLGRIVKSTIFTEATSVRTGNAFDVYMNHILPVFTTPNCADIQSGESVNMASILEATDAYGEVLDIRAKKGWDENFQVTDSLEVLEQTNLCFYDSGVFWIELYALDRSGRDCHAVVRMFANER